MDNYAKVCQLFYASLSHNNENMTTVLSHGIYEKAVNQWKKLLFRITVDGSEEIWLRYTQDGHPRFEHVA